MKTDAENVVLYVTARRELCPYFLSFMVDLRKFSVRKLHVR
jgi:hypothetical protein